MTESHVRYTRDQTCILALNWAADLTRKVFLCLSFDQVHCKKPHARETRCKYTSSQGIL